MSPNQSGAVSEPDICQAQPTDGGSGIRLDEAFGKSKVQWQHKAPCSVWTHYTLILVKLTVWFYAKMSQNCLWAGFDSGKLSTVFLD